MFYYQVCLLLPNKYVQAFINILFIVQYSDFSGVGGDGGRWRGVEGIDGDGRRPDLGG